MSKSQYAKNMAAMSAKIFGEAVTETSSKSMKIVDMYSRKPLAKRFEVTQYYPQVYKIEGFFRRLHEIGLCRDQHLDFREEMQRKREERGIVKTKKGEGKRALKRAAKKT